MKFTTTVSLVSLFLFLLNFSGCSNTPNPNSDLEKIQLQKQLQKKKQIHISEQKGYKAYIDRENTLRFISTLDEKKCNYYDHNKHNYFNGTPNEEFVYINKEGYYPPIAPNTHALTCGTGSLFGWLAIFPVEPLKITDYTKKHPIVCNSRFTTIDSWLIGARFGAGLVTFMTPFITGGNLHTKKFDKEEFVETIYLTNMESFRKKLLVLLEKYDIQGGIDVIYLQKGDIDENLEDKYNKLIQDKSLKAGVVFLEKESNKLLAIDIFAKYNTQEIMHSVSLQIEDMLHTIAQNNSYILRYEDIVPYIPKEISLPDIPPVKKLLKDEFETKKEFEKRVKKAVRQREEHIKALQKQYTMDVFARNAYIDGLQKAFEEYLQYKAEEKNALLKELEENMPLLFKVLFLENNSGYGAKDFTYDAENNKLYFKVYSKKGNFEQKVVATIPSYIAKRIKRNKTFNIAPNLEVHNNKLTLKGFEIIETTTQSSYEVSYTNIYFQPESISLRIGNVKESIKKQLSNSFKHYKQKNIPIVDTSKKEIWYIDVVKNMNASVPKWFLHPASDKIIGYGEGESLKKAKAKAREDLSYMIKVIINSNINVSQDVNNIRSFDEIQSQTRQNSNITLSPSEYKLYRQEKRDGIWYVGYEYVGR